MIFNNNRALIISFLSIVVLISFVVFRFEIIFLNSNSNSIQQSVFNQSAIENDSQLINSTTQQPSLNPHQKICKDLLSNDKTLSITNRFGLNCYNFQFLDKTIVDRFVSLLF
jgi:hypothetical protein